MKGIKERIEEKEQELREESVRYNVIMKNFKAPVFFVGALIAAMLFAKMYSYEVFIVYRHKVIFFAISLVLFIVFVSKLLIDLLSVVFGEKAKGSLVENGNENQ